jgi:excinuclease ABC subunit C
MEHLEQKLAHLPRRPGVYLMKDARGRLLYVGKAKRLDQRVRSYFGSGNDVHPKQAALVARIADLETIVTDSDVEALLLEMTLIKEKRPPYNIRLKDDKRFPFLKLTLAEEFPKAVITRRTPADGSRYFGPYTDAGALRRTLKMVRTIFPIRSCMGARPGRGPRYRECLDYHIHRCAAPCIDKIPAVEYRGLVERLADFLDGREDEVVADLRREMEAASAGLQFERAARLRDRIRGVERLMRRQKMLAAGDRDMDVFAFARDEDTAFGAVLQVRGGNVLGKERRRLQGTAAGDDAGIMAAFLTQYYRDSESIPGEVATAVAPAGSEVIESWLGTRAERRIVIRVPVRGRVAGLVRLAEENARLELEENRGQGPRGALDPAVYALQKALDLPSPPAHIEGFDISNIQGAHSVASVVVFRGGAPAKAAYRRFQIKTVEGPDDFASMAEVVARRARRILAGEFPAPDMILIDGGAGQVSAAVTALHQEGLEDVAVVGLAKRHEEIVLPGVGLPVRLPRNDPALKLLIRVRDEAHRFAVAFHRLRRGKETLASSLDAIPGVGRSRKIRLLTAFGSVDALRAASEDDIAGVPGIGAKVAHRIASGLREEVGEEAHDAA